MWNDSRIQAINSPEVAALLPGTPIKIVVEGYSSGYQTTSTYWLNATVSGWQVRVPLLYTQILFCGYFEC
jgi:Na+-driven multidrug efflux pump